MRAAVRVADAQHQTRQGVSNLPPHTHRGADRKLERLTTALSRFTPPLIDQAINRHRMEDIVFPPKTRVALKGTKVLPCVSMTVCEGLRLSG